MELALVVDEAGAGSAGDSVRECAALYEAEEDDEETEAERASRDGAEVP